MAIHYERDDEGIVTLTMDMSGSANVMNAEYHEAMGEAVARLEAERDDITGVVLTSAKKTFFAGGDLKLLIRLTPENAAEALGFLEDVKKQLRRLEQLGKPVVAAVNGSALGGGFEIALACHHRVVLDDDRIKVGLPEATLGLLPGGGGVTRLVRLLGVQPALPLLMEGRQLRPARALQAGIVHALASSGEDLIAQARAWIKANPSPRQPWDEPGYAVPDVKFGDPDVYGLLAAAPAVLRKKTHGVYPAPEKILAAAVEGALVDFDTALQIEGRYFVELVTGQVSKNMISTFWFQLNEIGAGRSRPSGVDATKVTKVGVLGAGMMGAGIAEVSAKAGIEVVLKDVTLEAATRGANGIPGITPTDSDADLAGCDLVIEAVFENRELKNEVLPAAESAALPDAVIASNTSTLPITGLSSAVSDPTRFIGLHFFSPVPKMRLVEIIRGEKTSDETLARAFDYVLQIGKTPIVVNDSRGFYTSRTFGTYVTEATSMIAEGVKPALIENVAKRSGMAVGPLAVSDEVTLTLQLKIRDQTLADDPSIAGALGDHPAFKVLEELVAEGRTGKAGGGGFYEYPEGAKKFLWPGLARYARDDAGVTEQDVEDRLLFIQSLETVRCLDEGVLTSVGDANVGSVFGFGFAPWSGGTLQFVNSYGLTEFVERADYLADTYGERFRPPASLRERATKGEKF
ncbi:3-hydroxyacyl-CoA dehydrogenase/enoyl-CoA hydratase/3-hydroxybutyryl-CoA epimerase [Saccharothrix tamanrassetensis]|uniref:3-hydroxyacyl-CoA dehydrogenase/enoyl-CoA hydratase/3-hydroxybutyryl-CoA epimerase n=1 Tax=Saccharothrix tamanrassetensis TaxID=1051531 RepID=A0A841CFS8_9PSEU|nr:3-hydroxyacyl-CoA dehydrogenase NAD-binding domain-containing protein [Saccharothrix tamanrassetensis]MBB5955850.1 3-hydroxyacyl-CoA dehydrogenase/enoyl-CoA hydratase/3-hydroxybutyryl-CoA epimerase [Saccharothrix tamanrassetensis]